MWHASPYSEVRQGPWCEDHYREVIAWGVVVSNERGRRYAYCGPVEIQCREQAVALADWVNGHARRHPEWSPEVKADYWNEIDPVYGSEEYQEQGTEYGWTCRERADALWE